MDIIIGIPDYFSQISKYLRTIEKGGCFIDYVLKTKANGWRKPPTKAGGCRFSNYTHLVFIWIFSRAQYKVHPDRRFVHSYKVAYRPILLFMCLQKLLYHTLWPMLKFPVVNYPTRAFWRLPQAWYAPPDHWKANPTSRPSGWGSPNKLPQFCRRFFGTNKVAKISGKHTEWLQKGKLVACPEI